MNFNDDNNDAMLSEINIVPLTDVMLVLLIIFMVTTPMLVLSSLNVKLPSAVNSKNENVESIILSIDKDGLIAVDDVRVEKDSLHAVLSDKLKNNKTKAIIIRGDELSSHGLVVFVLDTAKSAGAEKLSIATISK